MTLPSSSPDAHGQAALLLVESLLHALVARGVFEVRDAAEIVSVACEVKKEIADHSDEARETLERSLELLGVIAKSVRTDLA